MKTIYTTMAILALALFSQTATAKLGVNHSTVQLQSKIEVNIEKEIVYNIKQMLANVEAPAIKADAAKQLNIDTVQLQTNELVQNLGKKLPEFKFKVVFAD